MRFPDLKSREAYAIILNICKTDERAEEQMLKKWYAKLLVLLAVVCAVAAAQPHRPKPSRKRRHRRKPSPTPQCRAPRWSHQEPAAII